MKKLFQKLSLLLVATLLLVTVASCSFLGDISQGIEDSIQQKVTVYNGDTPTEYTFKFGEVVQIDIPVKQGYYFVGAYDAAEEGNQYFNIDGESTMVWQKGYPSVYYARFESIENCSFFEVKRGNDNPYSWEKGALYFSFALNTKMKNAIKGNLDANLKVKVSFEAFHEGGWDLCDGYITNLKSGGDRWNCFTRFTLPNKNAGYQNYAYTFSIPATKFKQGDVYFFVSADPGIIAAIAGAYYIKNIQLSISFDLETEE